LDLSRLALAGLHKPLDFGFLMIYSPADLEFQAGIKVTASRNGVSASRRPNTVVECGEAAAAADRQIEQQRMAS
jgi:hypothetical protein